VKTVYISILSNIVYVYFIQSRKEFDLQREKELKEQEKFRGLGGVDHQNNTNTESG